MFLTVFKSKIHRATVTEANLHYMGSITIDEALLKAADILPGEKVQVVNNTNGNRLETYVITGAAQSGVICLNGRRRPVSPAGRHGHYHRLCHDDPGGSSRLSTTGRNGGCAKPHDSIARD